MRPLVTIVTPTYNAAHWLPQCRASVLAQSYPNIEHVIVDGGSDDGTAQLLESWSDVLWISERDNGQSDAIIKGFRLGHGDVLTWLNADDELAPGAVETVVDAMERLAASWVVGAAEIREAGRSRVVRPQRVDVRALDLSNPIVQPSSMYTRTVFEAAGGLDPTLHLAMDLDLWLRLLLTGVRPHVVDDVLSIANLHEDAKTRAVSAAAWYREMGLARAKNGRSWAAAVELGRSLAEELCENNADLSPSSLRRHVEERRNLLASEGLVVPRWPLQAGASVRFAVLAQGRRRAAHLAWPEPWTTRPTVHELFGALTARVGAGQGVGSTPPGQRDGGPRPPGRATAA